MAPDNSDARACVLVLPGGKVRSDEASRWWQLANLRMVFIAAALRRRLGRSVEVRRVQYRRRGWNSPRLDAVRDAADILDQVRQAHEPRAPVNPKNIVLVGHSMGGRVAARLASDGDIGAVVALAPWWPREDGDLIPARTRLLVVHGTADTRTDPRSSRTQTCRARQRGLDAQWAGIEGAGHSMVRRWSLWHSRTTDFVAEYLQR
ncbi:MAG: alpha/beta hydrolase [Mycobacterium sp.]